MQQTIHFSKMHGAGNDFIVLDGVTQGIHLTSVLVQQLSDRRLGVGCDQILLLEPPYQPEFDFSYRIFNADGSEVAQCGNGARCIARFAYEHGLCAQGIIKLQTQNASILVDITNLNQIRATLGPIELRASAVPIQATPATGIEYALPFSGVQMTGSVLSLGNPHCVIMVPNAQDAPLDIWGPELQQSDLFPHSVNVSVAQVLAKNHISIRTFERGVGETPACGSAACASVIAGVKRGELGNKVQVAMRGGQVMVEYEDGSDTLVLSGPTAYVYEGQFALVAGAPHP